MGVLCVYVWPSSYLHRLDSEIPFPGTNEDCTYHSILPQPNQKTKHKGDPAFVLDCIDDAPTKAELLGYCASKGLRVIASLGAGLKVRVCVGVCGCVYVCGGGVWFRSIQARATIGNVRYLDTC